MNILILVHNLTGGGAERVAASWANGLTKLGHHVYIITDFQNQTYTISNEVVTIQEKIILRHYKSIIFKIIKKVIQPFVSFFQLIDFLSQKNPDAVIDVLYYRGITLLFARFFSRVRFPIIMTDHNVFERPKNKPFKWRQWRNKFIDNRLYDWVTVLTEPDKKILNNKGIKHVSVLHNPLFLNPIKDLPQKEKIILSVGRIDQWYVKGFDVLINSWNNITNNYPDWKLRIVGNGSIDNIAKLKSLIKNINSVEFGNFTEEIIEEYKKAAIYVMPSRYEGWGLVAVEAMSQGCATIVCDFGGRQREFINDGQNGIICEPDNVENLSKNISYLIDNKAFRFTLSKNGITSVAQYKEEQVALNMENIIKKLDKSC